MHVNSIAENVSLSLNFMGRKLRNHTVSPAAKQQAWARTSPSRSADDNSGGLSRTVRTQPLVCAQNELPGSIQELREEVQHQPCNVHNTHLDHENNVGVWKRGRTSWLRKSRIKWKSFKRWMSSEHYTEPSKNPAKDPNAASGSTRARDREDNAPAGVKIFIPYDAAKLCITQIADDMIAMKSRHLEMVQELEENFLMVSQENQERMVNKIRSYYQNKLNALKRVLKLYQENVERRSALWDENIKSLQSENERLQDEQKTLRERNRHDFSTWERERSKMMELFSSRLDQLHSHQASTLQELQMARMEMGHLQEILQSSKDPKDPETKETESSDSSAPLDDAKACLEELRESLYKREREISMLIDGSGVQNGVAPSTYARLLAAVVRQAHLVYAEVTEAKQQFDRMAEDNRKVVAEATARVMSFQNNQTNVDSAELRLLRMDQSGSPGGQVTQAALNLPSHEVLLVALECIKAGVTPILTGTVSEQDLAMLDESVKSFQDKFKNSGVQNSEVGKRVGQQLLLLQAELKQVKEENKKISEHYTAERTLRKKYYNMVEDMKGKIRVFCRIRPQTQAELARGSHTIVSCLDDYSVSVESPRGPREFQFDRIFTTENTQDDVFQETSRLIQSAVDGFNVCIFAYGQTGSGKTFTMLGDREQKNPGIIPRTFTRIFEIIQENESKFEFKDSKSDLILTFRIRMPEVSDELPIVIHKAKGPLEFKNGHGMWPLQCSQVLASMLELYNDRLQDLFVSPAEALSKRIEIKKDKKGLVFAQGAEAKEATSAGELFALFELGSANRHIAATKMNIESSRSHLIISIMLESRNLAKGSMTFGKLNLVDLAGSERAAKTGAKDDQLKEANSINKSLSALGDVIAALAMEQAHVPYRNNKLTQLMQDSLGGNAKTLMFLNISPSDCNLDETLTSLIYASRVKAITNHAQRNMESKEIAHLKEVILRLKSGQAVEEEDLTFTQMC